MASQIKNVFVLMLENRSFDHLLGFSGITGTDASTGQPTSINGLTGTQSNSFNGTTYPVHQPAVDPMTTDPGHEFLDTLQQLTGQTAFTPGHYPPINNSGFAANYATSTTEGAPAPPEADHIGDIMSCGDSSQVSALLQLAQEFAVCDNWFSSMPGPTWPNRLFAMGASSAEMDDSPTDSQILKWETDPFSPGFVYPRGSIFDLLTNNRLQWNSYNDKFNDFAAVDPGFTTTGSFPFVAAIHNMHQSDISSFGEFSVDLNNGYPYQFTWIEPNYGDIGDNSYTDGSSQHPMDSLLAGEKMIAATYNAIRGSAVWNQSLLIITYDEHGGFYDHAIPPAATPPGDGSSDQNGNLNLHGFDFSQFGVRVPAVIVSPLIPKNTIDHTLYDHTSILKTVEKLNNLSPLTNRDANANCFQSLCSLSEPRTDCPETINASLVPATPRVEVTAEERRERDLEPLPEKGNARGFLFIALKTDLELSDGSEEAKQAIRYKYRAIKTKEDARAYMRSVLEKAAAAKTQTKEKIKTETQGCLSLFLGFRRKM